MIGFEPMALYTQNKYTTTVLHLGFENIRSTFSFQDRFELSTHWLTASCSTPELLKLKKFNYYLFSNNNVPFLILI